MLRLSSLEGSALAATLCVGMACGTVLVIALFTWLG